jgi:hypothetical protein
LRRRWNQSLTEHSLVERPDLSDVPDPACFGSDPRDKFRPGPASAEPTKPPARPLVGCPVALLRGLSPTGDSVHSPRDPLLASGIKLTPDAHDFGRRVTASTSGLFGDLSGLRPARPHATPGRAVRDGPDLFGGRPGIDSGPRRLRAAVPRSAFWSLWPDAAARLSAGLPSRGCPCRAPRSRSIAPLRKGVPPSGGKWHAFLGSLGSPTPAQKSCSGLVGVAAKLAHDFRVLTLEEIGTDQS